MIDYPATFPRPTLEGFSITVRSGVIRDAGETSKVQRRVFDTMPHTFTLAFTMRMDQVTAWNAWVDANAYRWFYMRLPSMYAKLENSNTARSLLRFVSDVTYQPVSLLNIQAAVSAELAPSMIGKVL